MSYQNSISLSSSKSLNSRDDSLVSTMISSLPLPGARRKSEDYLTQMMISLKKFSKAHRLSFYLVDWASRVANAIYHKGLVSPIKQQIGKGNVGISIEKGVTINLADAYEDPSFDASIDMATGFRTKTLRVMLMHQKLLEPCVCHLWRILLFLFNMKIFIRDF